jgi:hypothetical protein
MRQVYGIWMYMDVYGIITCTWNAWKESLLFCNCCVVFFRLIQFKPACVQGARHTCHDGVLCSVLPLGPGWARSTKNSAYFNNFQYISAILWSQLSTIILRWTWGWTPCTHHPKVRAIWHTSRIRTWTNLAAFHSVRSWSMHTTTEPAHLRSSWKLLKLYHNFEILRIILKLGNAIVQRVLCFPLLKFLSNFWSRIAWAKT